MRHLPSQPLDISALLLAVLLLAACGAGGVQTPTSGPQQATATAPVISTESYPAPPTPTTAPEEYPGPATPAATAEPTAYPADKEVWIVRPLGQQCVDASTYEFATVDDAVQSLEDADVEVLAAEEVSRPVCQSCDCSTSEHFRVQIRAEDLAAAESMGWFLE